MTQSMSRSLGATLSALRRAVSGLWKIEARLKGVQLGQCVTFAGRPILSVAPQSNFEIGDGVTLASATRANPLGCFQPCVLRTLAPGAKLRLGRNVGVSGAILCAGLRVEVGDGTLIGSGAMIIDNDFHVLGPNGWHTEMRVNARPVVIGREVFIGARAIILKGVTIGDHAIVGAGAVVTTDVPARQIAAGNPARIFDNKQTSRLSSDQ